MKKVKCYCGPRYFPDKWKCALSGWFNIPCKRHDENYRLKKGRLWSDWQLLKDMLKSSRGNPAKIIVAIFYYLVVFLFGWISYYMVGQKGPEKD